MKRSPFRLEFAILFPLLLALQAFAPTQAQAAAVVIWPVDPKIEATERSAVLWLENRGKEPVTLQIRSLGWSQPGGEENYAQQEEVVASPPMAEVAPGQRQLVRLIRRVPTPATERAFRLLVDELPAPADAGAGQSSAKLAVQMRYSIPLFALGTTPQPAPKLNARIVVADGQSFVEIHNEGTRHARLTDLRAQHGGGAKILTPGLVGYVLPGATKRWPLGEIMPSSTPLVVGVNGADHILGTSL